MDKVIFTHFEHSDDIIIALSCDEASTFGVDGFIIQRTPKLEFALPPHERGACVEWEEANDIPVLLDQALLTRNEMRVITRGKVREYHFDLQAITDDEYQALLKHLQLLNFDHSFKLEIK